MLKVHVLYTLKYWEEEVEVSEAIIGLHVQY